MTSEQFLHELTDNCGFETTFNYIKNVKSLDYLESICFDKDNLTIVLVASFPWDESEQGADYWIGVYDTLLMQNA